MTPTTGPVVTKPEDLNAAIAATFAAGDLDGYIALHVPDATVVPPPEGRPVHGIDAIRAATSPIIELRPRLTSTVLEVVEGDGLALTHARWTLTARGPDGQPVEMEGRGTIVSVREADGSWRIAIDDPMTPA